MKKKSIVASLLVCALLASVAAGCSGGGETASTGGSTDGGDVSAATGDDTASGDIKDVGLLDNPLVMIIFGAVNVYNLIITRTFFETSIPDELYEAATLDGCSHFRYFGTIVLPLSKAVVAVIMLYYLVGHWNDFFNALLYLNSDAYQPLQIILRNLLLLNQAMAGTTGAGAGAYAQQYADQIKFGVIIVSTVPVLCVYPFIQKYFEKGVMIGAVKG